MFLVWGGFFPQPTKTNIEMAPLIISSLKSLEDHLLHPKDFAKIVGNISKAFQLAIIEKEAAEEGQQKSLREVAILKTSYSNCKLLTNKMLSPFNVCKHSYNLWKGHKRECRSWKPKTITTITSYYNCISALLKSISLWAP